MSTTKSGFELRWHRWLLATALGAGLVLSYAGQNARAEDDEAEPFDTKLFNQFMHSFGLRKEGDFIEYRERAPLVLPPGHDLPAPEANAKAKKEANWPDDPDVKRARKVKAQRKYSNPEPEDRGRPLRPGDYSLPGGASRSTGPARTTEDEQRAMSPAELGAKSFWSSLWGGGIKDEYATFTAEPSRQSLVDPPVGYRTPSPNQPYGVGAKTYSGAIPSVESRNDVVK